MKFDIQTLSVLVAVSALVFAFASLTVSRMIPSEKHLVDWAKGAGLAALSTFLVGLRGSVPDVVSATIANTFLVFGFSYLYLGTRGMFRRSTDETWLWMVGLGALVSLGWFTIFSPSLAGRVIIVSVVAAPLLGLIACEFWRHDRRTGPSPLRIANRLTVLICAIGALLFVLRLLPLLNGVTVTDYRATTSALFIAPYVWAILFNVWLSISVTLTVSSHLQNDLVAARDAAEASNIAKSRFLANMSHEIRTPMNAILGMLGLLQATELNLRQRDYADKTEGAAKSLLGLLNDILDFSKADADKMQLENLPFRLDRLLRDLSVVLSANVGAKDIEVLFDIDPTLPEVIQGDAMRLQQVLINLGGNAIKFTTHGQVVLALRKLQATPEAVTIEFSVKDSGIGIAPEQQAHVFTGFSQAEASTTRRFGGTGLGLAISKMLVELMGGQIRITSALDQGSTFSFVLTLPVVRDIPPELAGRSPSIPAPRPVLVVDDNPMAGDLTQQMVRSWGWPVDLATSGAQAMDMIRVRQAQAQGVFPYALIYMDWQMPGMDGWETTRQIRELVRHGKGPEPTLMMLTAHGRETLAQRSGAEQDMLNGFLVKPVTGAMLLEALADAGQGNSGLRQLSKGRSSQRQLKGMRILVVEDNLINQQVAEELLSAEGAMVSLAANGQLGVDAVAAAAPQFDAVLMDIQMPVLDGYGATRAIREDLGLASLCIVAMTANAMASDREACLAAGMNDHVGKPFDIGKLVSLLIRLTGIQPEVPDTLEAAPLVVQVPDAIPHVPGLDLDTALARMSGMRSLYVRTARDFILILDAIIPELRQCLQTGEKQTAFMRLHTLKGNAGTLGASSLAAKAAELEALCKAGGTATQCAGGLDELALLVQATQTMLARAIEHLEIKAVPVSSAAQPLDRIAALGALHELSALLRACDMAVLPRFTELQAPLAALPDAFCQQLDLALQGLEFEKAHSLCSAMIGQLLAETASLNG